jgi:hypothetical protein
MVENKKDEKNKNIIKINDILKLINKTAPLIANSIKNSKKKSTRCLKKKLILSVSFFILVTNLPVVLLVIILYESFKYTSNKPLLSLS